MPADYTTQLSPPRDLTPDTASTTHAERMHAMRQRQIAEQGRQDALSKSRQSDPAHIIQSECVPLGRIYTLSMTQMISSYWNGESVRFTVKDNKISIKQDASDGATFEAPPEEKRNRTSVDGLIDYFYPISPDDKRYVKFCKEVGKLCAFHVLGRDKRSNYPWFFELPQQYTLWFHKDGDASNEASARKDLYLYGHCTYIFRSPQEFAPHAISIMTGEYSSCICKGCNPGSLQENITARLYGTKPKQPAIRKSQGNPFVRKPRHAEPGLAAKDYTSHPHD